MENWSIADYLGACLFLFCFVFFVFMQRRLVIIDRSKAAPGKVKDSIKYYPLVKEWLKFPESKKFTPNDNSMFPSDLSHQVLDAIYILNPLLPVCYQISSDIGSVDFKNFSIMFQEYQKSMCHKFFTSSYRFSAHYLNYFSHKNKKLFHPQALKETWGAVLKENLFFTETLCDFLEISLDCSTLAEKEIYVYSNGEYYLTPFGRTLFKAYLSTLFAKKKIGYTAYNNNTKISFSEAKLKTDVIFNEEEMDDLLQSAGILNPYTQSPISSLAELQAYREKFREDRRKEFINDSNMTQEEHKQDVVPDEEE